MKTKWIALGLLAVVVGVVGAAAVQTYYYPQTASIGEIELETFLDGALWLNTTTIDWGTVYPDNMYSYNLSVRNLVDTSVLVYIEFADLPVGWVETWDGNGTVLEYRESVFGWLNLTVPLTASDGLYEWDSYIKGEYT